jgi:hypothetical protein
MSPEEAFAQIVRQAAASGAIYAFENTAEFFGSNRPMTEHFESVVDSFLNYRDDLMDDFKEAVNS